MKKLIIIGVSILQLPAIKKAKKMGIKVAEADFNPHAIDIHDADKYFNTSSIEIEAICKVTQEYRSNGILTLANEITFI
jgi:hypothetical protein